MDEMSSCSNLVRGRREYPRADASIVGTGRWYVPAVLSRVRLTLTFCVGRRADVVGSAAFVRVLCGCGGERGEGKGELQDVGADQGDG